ncbi:MAG: riboflavin biosynthesis protein RibF [Chthonomonas sp.]|nr:riboflavin biosynthesis protein RibF [Chthonomonas sp.]
MLLHFGVETIQPEWPESIVSIGTFDGVHFGHQDVLRRNVEASREHLCPSIVVTFDRNPSAVVHPERAPLSIASLNDNIRMLSRLNLSLCVILEFGAALSRMSAQEFFDQILIRRLRARKVVVGYDFAFGNGRQGTTDWLRERIETEVVPPFEIDGVRVSSTTLRQCIAEGRVEEVTRLRGTPFEMPGVVIRGQQLGRTIGFPTINLARSTNQIVPADGVYAGFCRCSQGEFLAAISIGMRPTVDGTHRTIEAFLLDYPGESLYGESLSLGITHRLRDEWKFETLEKMIDQIHLDVAQTRSLGILS